MNRRTFLASSIVAAASPALGKPAIPYFDGGSAQMLKGFEAFHPKAGETWSVGFYSPSIGAMIRADQQRKSAMVRQMVDNTRAKQ